LASFISHFSREHIELRRQARGRCSAFALSHGARIQQRDKLMWTSSKHVAFGPISTKALRGVSSVNDKAVPV